MNADDVVTGLAEVTGQCPGQRLLHARGSWVRGVFTAAPQGEPVPVVARLSGTRGGLDGHDADSTDQGIAVRFPDWDLITFTAPVFFVRTAAELVGFLAANPPPEPTAAPAGFLGLTYHSVHAFGLDGLGWARLEWHPRVVADPLDIEVARGLAPDYLHRDLTAALPGALDLYARLPDPDDAVHDPTAEWRSTTLIRLGAMELLEIIDAPVPEPEFDPLRLPSGIQAPLDELAAGRSAVYRAARARRG
ncbi:hypothetical protein D5S17_00900 [Pseudonocardiaceae bacterium YIM PH 21723]|nr:hypothetical protein D5S17_00900 [Pseudonocardiaceae bacterium YIM PH 21723]